MYTFYDIAFWRKLYEVGIGTALQFQVEGIDVRLAILSHQHRVGLDFETIGILRRHLVTVFIRPCNKVVAEGLGSSNSQLSSFIELCTSRVARHTAGTFHTQFHTHGISRNGLGSTTNVTCHHDITKTVFLVGSQAVDLDFQHQSVAADSQCRQVVRASVE